MTEPPELRRGDVVLAALPLVTEPGQSKLRPAVVIQNDVGNRFSPNVIVVAISSRVPAREYPTDLIVPRNSDAADGTGLDRDSVVQAAVILTIPKTRVTRRVGRFGPNMLRAIDQRVKVSVGLE